MSQSVVKVFNTAGPCVAEKHYLLPVLERQPGIDEMIKGEYYFILHAPRKSGKTTYLKSLTNHINFEGKYYALYCSLEANQDVTDDVTAMTRITVEINNALKYSSIAKLSALSTLSSSTDPLPDFDPSIKVSFFLNYLCVNLDKDLVIFFDEADCLIDPPLITFLRQIRIGYNNRSDSKSSKFPRSMALVGLRDIRDYLVQVRPDNESRGLASPFNIKKGALTLPNFTQDEIGILYRQHTEASGQVFEDRAIERAWYWSEGQPWLVNALADEAIVTILKKDFGVPITFELIDQAAENLIKRQDVHIDSLLEKLKEPRVARVMDAVFAGTDSQVPPSSDDRRYCQDLGLVVLNQDENLRPANPIYAEVMSRVITDELQRGLKASLNKAVNNLKWTDGKELLLSEILAEFQKYWRKNSDSFPKRLKSYAAYKFDEAFYSFVLLTYLQKIVNSGAKVDREYAEGRGAVDICVTYNEREYLIEVKIKGEDSENESIEQLAGYLEKNGEKEGWLVIFDRNRRKSWDKKITWKTIQFEKYSIHIVGC